jgi:peptidoglycan/LPS O-acetylase OafA/YrhL
MRKLIWFILIVLVVALGLAVACNYSPEFSATLYDFGVNTVGGGIMTSVTGALTGLMLWGSEGLANSVAILAGTLIAGSILWIVLLKRYIWPKIKGVTKPITPTISLRGGPEPELPQTIEQAKPEAVKEEK